MKESEEKGVKEVKERYTYIGDTLVTPSSEILVKNEEKRRETKRKKKEGMGTEESRRAGEHDGKRIIILRRETKENRIRMKKEGKIRRG